MGPFEGGCHYLHYLHHGLTLGRTSVGKDCLQHRRPGFNPLVGKIPWRRKWQPTSVFLPGESHGRRSLVGYNPWGRKELDTTERLHFHFSLSCIGEGNGNPLQCCCLENPRDGASLVGCHLWGRTESDTTEVTYQQQQQQNQFSVVLLTQFI